MKKPPAFNTCAACGDSYRVRPCKAAKSRFCSQPCTWDAQRRGITRPPSGPSRFSRRWTPEEDAIVRDHYLTKGARGIVHMLRARTKTAIKDRAVVLGVATTTRPWTPEEEAWLARNAQATQAEKVRKLKRSRGAIRQRLVRLGLGIANAESFTAAQAAQIMGVEPRKVAQWIRQGLLKAKQVECTGPTDRHLWQIRPADLRDFCKYNPGAFDIRKVDKIAFHDLIFNTTAYRPREKQA